MQSRKSPVLGIILVAAGSLILLRDVIDFDPYWVRSYGLFLAGIAGLFYGITQRPPRSIFLFSFLTQIGFFYILSDFNFFYVDRGLTISVFLLAMAGSFLAKYLLVKTQWQYLLSAGMFGSLGLLCLLFVFDFVSPYLFDSIVNDYWPVVLILAGLGFMVNSMRFGQKSSTDIARDV